MTDLRILALFGSRVIFGAERENIEVLAALREQGGDVLCLVRPEAWNDHVPAALAAHGLAFEKVPYIDGWLRGWRLRILLRNPFAFIAGNWRLLVIARRFRPTHVHAFNPFFMLSFFPALLLLRLPLIYRSGDVPARHRWIWRVLWRLVVRRTSRFVAVSHFIAGELAATGVDSDRIEVIYARPPTRPGLGAAPPAMPADAAIQDVVFVGQMIEDKGPHLLIEAFRTLGPRYPAARLLVAGRISDWRGDDWARNLRDRTGRDPVVAARVAFLGFVEDVPGLLRGRTVLVAPTLIDEALGLVVMEAKAAGVPAVVFASGGLPEMIEPGVDGFVCERKTADGLVEALAIYLNDPSVAARHGQAARASLGRFGVVEFGTRWQAAYRAAIDYAPAGGSK